MKITEIETSKCTILVSESDEHYDCRFIGLLSRITEEQASEVVDKVMNNQHFQNYNFKSYNDRWVKTAIESLHSLLKSEGIHLYENPAPLLHNGRLEAESKTFYNPYIFIKK